MCMDVETYPYVTEDNCASNDGEWIGAERRLTEEKSWSWRK